MLRTLLLVIRCIPSCRVLTCREKSGLFLPQRNSISNAPLWRYLQGKGDQWIRERRWRWLVRRSLENFPQGWEWHRGCYGNPRSEYQNPQPLTVTSARRQTCRGWLPRASFYPLPQGHRAQVWCERQWPERNVGEAWDAAVRLATKTQAWLSDSRATAANAISHFLCTKFWAASRP